MSIVLGQLCNQLTPGAANLTDAQNKAAGVTALSLLANAIYIYIG